MGEMTSKQMHTQDWGPNFITAQEWEDSQTLAEVKLSAECLPTVCMTLDSIPNATKCTCIKDYTESKTFYKEFLMCREEISSFIDVNIIMVTLEK